jgi:hypothetical protein
LCHRHRADQRTKLAKAGTGKRKPELKQGKRCGEPQGGKTGFGDHAASANKRAGPAKEARTC